MYACACVCTCTCTCANQRYDSDTFRQDFDHSREKTCDVCQLKTNSRQTDKITTDRKKYAYLLSRRKSHRKEVPGQTRSNICSAIKRALGVRGQFSTRWSNSSLEAGQTLSDAGQKLSDAGQTLSDAGQTLFQNVVRMMVSP
jgi:hypothetical protein